jgi:hypothetical protein
MGETASVNVIARICKPSGPFVNFDEKGGCVSFAKG